MNDAWIHRVHIGKLLFEVITVQLPECLAHLVCCTLHLGNVNNVITLLHFPGLSILYSFQGLSWQVKHWVVVSNTLASCWHALSKRCLHCAQHCEHNSCCSIKESSHLIYNKI